MREWMGRVEHMAKAPDGRRFIAGSRRVWMLMGIDIAVILLVNLALVGRFPSENHGISTAGLVVDFAVCAVSVIACRILMRVYLQVWRYANTTAYLRLCAADVLAGFIYVPVVRSFLPEPWRLTFLRGVSVLSFSLLITLLLRFLYHYLREKASRRELPRWTEQLTNLLFEGNYANGMAADNRIKIVIVGAGRVGAMLAEELVNNPRAAYRPMCFIEVDKEKIGRDVMGLPVIAESATAVDVLRDIGVQEVVFALPHMEAEAKKRLYERYRAEGFKIKAYDYPLEKTSDKGKRTMRDFSIEELLFRKPMEFIDTKTGAFFRDKVVLVSGGGGSIGSELCRQIARMHPRQLIVLDIYENNAYDIQQELKITYGDRLDLRVEIASVRDEKQLEHVFALYRPQVVLHAAAHKHVPLMEHNVSEAVKNNVFGTLNMANVSEKYGVEKFIMISTDKAVNPTNAMGATKRMCEMIVQSRAGGKTCFSATRFGNVLGSNGSVIPLFKRQILNGGPVTLTDKRIIRYFMTIPEASQLVLQSAAMAQSGELYVLDMGKPVKILDLAENMIRLMGYEPYRDIDIEEVGLRPGEKLYEELLIKTEELDKTDSNLIFVERDKPLPRAVIDEKLDVLRHALETEDDEKIRAALKETVPTYHSPNAVNAKAIEAEEMREADGKETAVRTEMAG